MGYSLLSIATHEAGHAVASLALNCREVRGISLGRRPDLPGMARVTFTPCPDWACASATKNDPQSLDFWQDYLVVTLAGPAAMERLHPHAARLAHAAGDDAEVYRLIRETNGCPGREWWPICEEHYQDLKAGARELVTQKWAAVQSIAAALAKVRDLTGAEIVDLYNAA